MFGFTEETKELAAEDDIERVSLHGGNESNKDDEELIVVDDLELDFLSDNTNQSANNEEESINDNEENEEDEEDESMSDRE